MAHKSLTGIHNTAGRLRAHCVSLSNTFSTTSTSCPHTYAFTTRTLCILSPVAWVTLIIGCERAHGRMQERGVQGSPVMNKGSVIHPLQYLECECVFMNNLHRFPMDTCACLSCYDNYCKELTLKICVWQACAYIQNACLGLW